jgi:dTDP-4-dehydrorhamnose reductase
MKIGVTGYNGNVGKELIKHGCVPLECDVTKEETIREALSKEKPDIVIHTAAISSVEECEKDGKKAFDVNVRGTSNLVECMTKKQTLIFLSTNHVFSGKKFFPYAEIHRPSPTNTYGFTKWTAEHAARFSIIHVIIVRSNRLFNKETLFDDIWRLKNGALEPTPKFIKRSFTFLPDFVECLLYVAEHKETMPGLLHVSTNETWSYYQFWQLIAMELGLEPQEYVKARTHEIEGMPPRPYRAGFDVGLAKKNGIPIPTVLEGVKKMLRG